MINRNEQNTFYSIYYLCDTFYKWLDKDICAIFTSDVGKWRLIGFDSENYDDIFLYCDDRARVLKNGKYGYIDRDGREIIPCRYRKAEDFHQGLALVEEFEIKELINKTGVSVNHIEKGYVEKTPEGYRVSQNPVKKEYQERKEKVAFDKDIPLIIIGGRLLVKRDCNSIEKGLEEIEGTILLIERNDTKTDKQILASLSEEKEKTKIKELAYQ